MPIPPGAALVGTWPPGGALPGLQRGPARRYVSGHDAARIATSTRPDAGASDAPLRPKDRVRGSPPLDRPPRSVAVVLLSAIGDVVHGMPVATSLRRAWPDARIDWVIQASCHPLVAPHPAVDGFHVFRRDRGLRAFLDVRRRAGGHEYDLVIDLQVYLKAGLLTWLLDAPVKLGFDRERARDLNPLFTTHRIPPRGVRHVQDQYFEFLEHLEVSPVRAWEFALSEAERAARERFLGQLDRPALAVVVRTTRAEKDWIPERYARVLEAASADLGLRPVLVGSDAPEERRVARDVIRRTGARVVDARANDLRRLAWLLDGAALTLSPDTGPLHVSAALGTPVVGLYGFTDPKRTGPYPEEYRDLVVDRFTRPGETRPTAEFRPGNMERITVDDVLGKLEEAVRRHV